VFQADELGFEVVSGGRARGAIMAKLHLDEASPCGVTVGPETIGDDQGLVYSSSRAEVYVFGGLHGGEPSRSAWVHSLARNEWTEVALEAANAPVDVIAATYRMEDGKLYIVDRLRGEERLLSWDGRSGSVEKLGVFPDRWQHERFERRWLVAGMAGDLFYVGSKENFTVLVRLGFTDTGRTHVLGVKEIRKPIFGRPIAAPDAIAYTTVLETPDGQRPVQEVTPFGDFRREHSRHRFGRGEGWAPRL
jgi:hypothetical protein